MTLSALSLCDFRKRNYLGSVLIAGFLCSAILVACSGQAAPTHTPSATLTPSPTATAVPPETATLPPETATLPPSPSPAATIDPTSAPTATMIVAPTAPPPLLGSVAPDFEFKLFQGEETLGNRELRLSNITGRPLVLNFWARFCGPCWHEMPDLQDFYEEYNDRIHLLGIDVGQFTGLGSPKNASRLLDALGVTYPAGYTDDAQVVINYRVRAMPTTVFIDSEGRVYQAWSGAINRDQLESIVAAMLVKE